jgi:nucleoid-associated protein YgaU
MGKDFRIGLMVGLVLALAILLWVATRPSLTSQVPAAPGSALSQTDTGGPLPRENAGPQAGAGRPEPAGRSATSEDVSDTTRPPEPQSQTPSPTADAGTQPRGSMPTRAEPVPDSASGANPVALPDLTIYERAEKIKTTKFHIIQRGETLSGIARRYYGAPDQWRKILTANQNVIKDPDKLTPGTKLIIPE